MISDDPDEDANALDDDQLVENFLGLEGDAADDDEAADGHGVEQEARAHSATLMPDWPPPRPHDLEIALDTGTLGWFKANHANWRMAVEDVLRAWVEIKNSKQAAQPHDCLLQSAGDRD